MRKVKYIISALAFVISATTVTFAGSGGDNFVAPGAELVLVQGGYQFTEGPAADANGDIYFTDIIGGKILKWTWQDNSISVYKVHECQPNGLMVDTEGNLVICEMDNNQLTRDDLKGNMTVIADNWNGQKFHMPNDLWIDEKGGIYFSDFGGGGGGGAPAGGGPGGPGGEMPDGMQGAPDMGGAPGGGMPDGGAPGGQMPGGDSGSDSSEGLQVYYIKPDLSVVQATTDLVAPNGLVGTPDGKTLYVTDPGDNKTWSFKINDDGTLSDKKLFTTETTDGFTLDENGNVYFSGDVGVTIYSPEGEKIGEIEMPEHCTNLEFGGKERKTLFITAGTNIYTIEMAVKGAATALDLSLGRK